MCFDNSKILAFVLLYPLGLYVMLCFLHFSSFLQDHRFLVSHPPLPEGGQLKADPAPSNSEAPEADECQGGDDVVDSQEDSGSTTSPPPAISKDKGPEKKKKRLDDLVSSCTCNPKDASGEPAAADTSSFEMFDALDS
jgi:hypothetical protein